jgi:predicted nucleic acid-binding protein
MIIIDTTIWSKAYRRKKMSNADQAVVHELYKILESEEEVLIGAVRQELLSGIANQDISHDLAIKLNGFNNYEAQVADHDLAAEYFTICSQNGIQGSQIDFLICAIAHRYNFQIYTEDKDFNYYKKYFPISLY